MESQADYVAKLTRDEIVKSVGLPPELVKRPVAVLPSADTAREALLGIKHRMREAARNIQAWATQLGRSFIPTLEQFASIARKLKREWIESLECHYGTGRRQDRRKNHRVQRARMSRLRRAMVAVGEEVPEWLM